MEAVKKFFENYQQGVVTVTDWVFMADGEEYKYLWCANWMIVTDAMVPLDKFKSSEKWALAGIVNEEIKILIPGCRVQGFASCDDPPNIHRIYKAG